jgi:hypothetical protein
VTLIIESIAVLVIHVPTRKAQNLTVHVHAAVARDVTTHIDIAADLAVEVPPVSAQLLIVLVVHERIRLDRIVAPPEGNASHRP